MKAYRVYWETTEEDWDGWGSHRGKDEARYFFNKEEAEKFYETGKYYRDECRVWSRYANGEFSKHYGTIDKRFAEEYKERGDKVEIVKVEYNKYSFEEIEVE